MSTDVPPSDVIRAPSLLAACLCAMLAWLAGGPAVQADSPPVDNPVATHYSAQDGYPAWTDRIRWDRVIDMSRYATGRTPFEKFEAARDELHARGGGVLYYPAGTYDFSEGPFDGPRGRGLMLKRGVVIRGEKPAEDANARKGTLSLRTHFVFGFQQLEAKTEGRECLVPRDWNFIGMTPGPKESLRDVHDVGVAWVHITGGTVYFGPQFVWGRTWGSAKGWKTNIKPAWTARTADGTHPVDPFAGVRMKSPDPVARLVGVGSGRLVFGCVLADSAVLNNCFDEVPKASNYAMYKFGPRIGVYGDRVLVANNLLPESKRNFLYKQMTLPGRPPLRESTVLFDYGKTCGIDVNKDLLGVVRTGYEQPGIVVRDNWVFNHGHKGFNISGNWVTIRDNRNERLYLKGGEDVYGLGGGWRLTLDGCKESQNGGEGHVSDNLSRAFDLAGSNLWVHGNWYTNTGSFPGNDGEGILAQAHGGSHIRSWAITRNTHVQGKGEAGYIGGYDVNAIGLLLAWNTQPGWIGVKKARTRVDCAFLPTGSGGGVRGGDGGDVIVKAPGGRLQPPTKVLAEAKDDHVIVTWQDVADNEIGFRVERSVAKGPWTAIAYRPRHALGSPENPQAWADFLAPSGKTLRYRVVAIDEGDGDEGASEPTPELALKAARR